MGAIAQFLQFLLLQMPPESDLNVQRISTVIFLTQISHPMSSNSENIFYINSVVDLDGNPAIWQHSIVEMIASAWLLSLDSESQLNVYLIKAF